MNYAKMAKMIAKDIRFFGDSSSKMTLKRGGGVKMVGGQEIANHEIELSVTGVIRAPTQREVDGDMILVTDKIGIFTAEVDILDGDVIVVDGESYRVTFSRPYRPASVTLAYHPVLRRVAVHG